MTDDSGGGAQTSVERRLLDHLGSLRAHPPQAPEDFAGNIVRTARWQAAARPYLDVAGGFGVAVVTAMHVLLEPRRTQ
jgi:hypothetical protein